MIWRFSEVNGCLKKDGIILILAGRQLIVMCSCFVQVIMIVHVPAHRRKFSSLKSDIFGKFVSLQNLS